MSFRNTKTPLKPLGKAKWQLPKVPPFGRYVLEGENLERFRKLYPKHSNARLMKWFGISFSTLQRFRRELGLEKDMAAVRRQQARDTVKICEANGYYDSIRGRKPSEATMEGARKLRETGFNPMRRLKETNPRKFRAMKRKWGQARREVIKAERFRLLYGLTRKTRLKISAYPLSSAATSQKNSMISRNNYFAAEGHPSWVCWDADTVRSPRREATAVRHGLKIVEGQDDKENNN